MAKKKVVPNKFPATVYLAYEQLDAADDFLMVAESAADHLSTDGEKQIATYELVDIKTGKLVPEFS